MHNRQQTHRTRPRDTRRPRIAFNRSVAEWMGHIVVADVATRSEAPCRHTTRRAWRELAESVGW
jgi:hypothetical protein